MSATSAAGKWLMGQVFRKCPGCAEVANGWCHINRDEAEYIAAEILTATGVEVELQYAGDPTGPRIAILLPQGIGWHDADHLNAGGAR